MNKNNKMSSEIVAHSVNVQGDELISVLCTFPRIILAEVNTHRMLSKNTSSSRAIPFNKMVEAVKTNPFVPIAWQKEHKGMQGTEYFTNKEVIENHIQTWLYGRDEVITAAFNLNEAAPTLSKEGHIIEEDIEGVTKQLCNRLLEPFMWTTMLITGSKEGWDNFFKLRCPVYTFHTDESENDFVFKSKKDAINYFPKDEVVEYKTGNVLLKDLTEIQWLQVNQGYAEIHIMALAESIWDNVNESTPKLLQSEEWHIPFENKIQYSVQDGQYTTYLPETLVKISTAMAARTSYTVVGEEKEVDYQKMIDLHDKLLAQNPPHSSPLEHCCKALNNEEYYTFNKGCATNADDIGEGLIFESHSQGWVNNIKGFMPYRYIVDNSLSL